MEVLNRDLLSVIVEGKGPERVFASPRLHDHEREVDREEIQPGAVLLEIRQRREGLQRSRLGPQKPAWDKPLENITNNCDRYAQYASSVNQYTVNFVNYDGTTLQTNTVDYGSSIEYSGAKPTKPADDDYGYVFTGWDNATSAITGDVTATAQFTKADYLDYVLSSDKSAYTVFSASGVTLPSKIGIPDTYLGLPVTRIGNSAFKETNIAEVLGGGKITEIGDCAFSSWPSGGRI